MKSLFIFSYILCISIANSNGSDGDCVYQKNNSKADEIEQLSILVAAPLNILKSEKTIINFEIFKKVAIEKYGSKTNSYIQKLENYLEKISKLPNDQKVLKINQYINDQFLFKDDLSIWGNVDYWATPLDMFSKLAGDCEDFAILKYLALIHLGIEPDKLKIAYVKIHNPYSHTKDESHMILKYYPENNTDPLILDSIVKDIYPASKRNDLIPYYEFNHKVLYINNDPNKHSIEKISKWSECLEKMKQEGINL